MAEQPTSRPDRAQSNPLDHLIDNHFLGGEPIQGKPDRGHLIWTADGRRLSLDDAEWSDTAVPWRSCAARLVELATLVASTPLRIESYGNAYLINDAEAFLQWVETVFERDHPQGFGRILRARQQAE